MKIGIFTFHVAHNYGAVLQAFALQHKLRELSHDVEFVNYKPAYLTKPYGIFPTDIIFSENPKAILKKLINYTATIHKNLARRRAFNKFIDERLQVGPQLDDGVAGTYDAYVFGSDQIWNFNMTGGFDDIYFGRSRTLANSPKIAYAASFGNAKIGDAQFDYLKEALEQFNYISLREQDTIEELQPIIDKKITKVLDPTLVIDPSIWDGIAAKPDIDREYVLVYQIHRDDQTIRIARDIANQLKANVIEIPTFFSVKQLSNELLAASPESFVGLFKHASCVVTTSFHGTAFPIIFNRPFYVVNTQNGVEKRAANLLKDLNLSDRLIDKGAKIEFKDLDFKRANRKLRQLQITSSRFLQDALHSVADRKAK